MTVCQVTNVTHVCLWLLLHNGNYLYTALHERRKLSISPYSWCKWQHFVFVRELLLKPEVASHPLVLTFLLRGHFLHSKQDAHTYTLCSGPTSQIRQQNTHPWGNVLLTANLLLKHLIFISCTSTDEPTYIHLHASSIQTFHMRTGINAVLAYLQTAGLN